MGKTTDLNNTTALRLRNEIRELSKTRTGLDLDLGKALFRASRLRMKDGRPFYKFCKYTNWADFVEVETGLSSAYASQLRTVYRIFGLTLAGKFDGHLLSGVSASKLYQLRNVVTASNVEKWLNLAKTTNIASLSEAVHRRNSDEPLPFGGFESAHFRLTKTELHDVENALKLIAKSEPKPTRRGTLLADMARAFLRSRGHTTKGVFKPKIVKKAA